MKVKQLSWSEKDEILDAVADQIAEVIAESKQLSIKSREERVRSTDMEKYLDDIIETKQRISALETKLEKKLQDSEIIMNSLEKQMSEKYHSVSSEGEKEYFKLVDQIAVLRAGIIRLSNEIKEIKIQLALRKM